MNSLDIKILTSLSKYLNENPDLISENQINKLVKQGLSIEYSYRVLLLEYLGINDPKEKNYFLDNLKCLDTKEYMNNPYYKNIPFKNIKRGNFKFQMDKYKPYELFVKDDFIESDNMILPSLGYFTKPFSYPAVYEGNRLWMSISPNEINTMVKPIEDAYGNVLTIGLGLGYYSYMVNLKDDVESLTIVEKDKNVISLFKEYILPYFKNKDRVRIINDDAFDFLDNNKESFDYMFIDIWHDVSDGLPLYKRFKAYEEKYNKTKFSYWIYETMKYYL